MGDRDAPAVARVRKPKDVIIAAERLLAVALLVMILGLTFAQVVARFVFNSPFFWTEELARYGYVWLCFTAAIAVAASRSHITVELFEERLSRTARLLINAFGLLAVVTAVAMLAYGSVGTLIERSIGRSPALGIPTSALYGVVYASFIAMALHSVANLFALVRDHRLNRDMAPATQSAPEVTL